MNKGPEVFHTYQKKVEFIQAVRYNGNEQQRQLLCGMFKGEIQEVENGEDSKRPFLHITPEGSEKTLVARVGDYITLDDDLTLGVCPWDEFDSKYDAIRH